MNTGPSLSMSNLDLLFLLPLLLFANLTYISTAIGRRLLEQTLEARQTQYREIADSTETPDTRQYCPSFRIASLASSSSQVDVLAIVIYPASHSVAIVDMYQTMLVLAGGYIYPAKTRTAGGLDLSPWAGRKLFAWVVLTDVQPPARGAVDMCSATSRPRKTVRFREEGVAPARICEPPSRRALPMAPSTVLERCDSFQRRCERAGNLQQISENKVQGSAELGVRTEIGGGP
ncbi:uncharacterized protein BJX67DRAFT_244235 [Aspergillus lucknowensis]|uniref:Uncharacterized protein n=1 Tax=Aspergillus lucknowensis TaxID=176173 RepID=A0ABR4M1E1_9EURO